MAVATRDRGGYQRIVQESFAAGMFRAGSPELIPSAACYDAYNGLLDLLGGLYKRGGSSYRSVAPFGAGIRFLWDGWLTGGQVTVVGAVGGWGRLNGDGTMTALGGSGAPNPGRGASINGVLYLPGGNTYDGTTLGFAGAFSHWAVVANRLLRASGRRVEFSEINKPGSFNPTDYHELPGGVEILGIAGGRESAVVFTTEGVWVISNLALNLTDSSGNVQQRLDHYSGDLILWGDAGVTAWEGGLIVPGTDAVWLIRRGVSSEQVGSFERISDPIGDLYREYVKAGYEPGQGAVFNNHYLLPVLGGGRVVDLLVCRLEGTPRPWTRLGGYGAQMAAVCARVSSSSSRRPELLGGSYGTDSRVLTLSYFTPSSENHHDADGSSPEFSVITRAYPTGNLVANLVSKLRVRYSLWDSEGAPKLLAQVASDGAVEGATTWGAFDWGEAEWSDPGQASLEVLTGEAPPTLDGVKPHSWSVRKKRRAVRLRLSCEDATSQLRVKSLELFVRAEGRA